MAENPETDKLNATTMGGDAKMQSVDSDVDALIAGAMAELSVKPLSATPIQKEPPPAPSPKPATASPPPPPTLPPKEEQQYASTFKEYNVGDIITGTVSKVDNSGALIDISYKSDGLLAASEIKEPLKVGDKINVMIEKLESKEGCVILSKSGADEELHWKRAFEAYRKRELLEAKVKKAVKGGLLIECEGIPGFVPASHVSKSPETSLETFTGKTIPVKILEINRHQGKIVFSNRQAAGEKEKADSQKLIEELEVGQVRKGKVVSFKNFGAFVDLGGMEGLIHLSELSWRRVKHPSEVLKIGEEIEVLILGIDKINKKVSLGIKELQDDPWEKASERYKAGQIIKVKILRLVKFGAFAELDPELEGLIHISEISTKRFEKLEDIINPGDMVDAKILRILPDEQRIGLSIKQAVLEHEKVRLEKAQIEEEKPRITIGDMLVEKERQKAELEETEDQITEEIT